QSVGHLRTDYKEGQLAKTAHMCAIQRRAAKQVVCWKVLIIVPANRWVSPARRPHQAIDPALYFWTGRGGRVAEGARLESVYTGNRIEGSNPSLSASFCQPIF